MAAVRILFVGDVVGAPGLRALREQLPALVRGCGADLVVANGENAAGGLGITPAVAQEMFAAGVGVITTGNHVWDKKEILGRIDGLPRLLRPANYPPSLPGAGFCVAPAAGVPVGVLNLSGRLFMNALDCPFRAADAALQELAGAAAVVLVDFHAEATSEKRAMGWYLDGRVTAVIGTHTHVATADAQVLPGGTGYLSDAGMTGVLDSVIGVPADKAVQRFLTGVPYSLGVARGEPALLGALVEADAESGRCLSIRRVEAGALPS